ncbi:MAG: YIP1 family protein [Nitrospirota bacterium]
MFCPHCGKEISEGEAFCRFCGGATAVQAAVAPGTGRSKTAWEDERTQWTFGGLLTTLKGSLFNPSEFFRTMTVTGGLTGPMLYAMIVGMAGIMMFYFWQIALHDTYPAGLSSRFPGATMFSGVGMGVLAVVTPFAIIAGLFLGAGMLHLLLLMVRGSKNGFEATFRVVAYAYGSNIFMAVPFCGGFIAALWNIVVVIIGLKEAHGTSGGKAAFAVLFPVLLCCAVAVLFSILVLGTVAASLSTMPQQPWK